MRIEAENGLAQDENREEDQQHFGNHGASLLSESEELDDVVSNEFRATHPSRPNFVIITNHWNRSIQQKDEQVFKEETRNTWWVKESDDDLIRWAKTVGWQFFFDKINLLINSIDYNWRVEKNPRDRVREREREETRLIGKCNVTDASIGLLYLSAQLLHQQPHTTRNSVHVVRLLGVVILFPFFFLPPPIQRRGHITNSRRRPAKKEYNFFSFAFHFILP